VDGGHVDLLAFEQLSDSKDLQPGVHAPGGGVGAAGGGFCAHGLGGFLHRDQHAEGSVFAVNDAVQVADMGCVGTAGFNREDDLFGFTAVLFVEVEPTVNTLVCAFFCSIGRAPTRPSAHHWN